MLEGIINAGLLLLAWALSVFYWYQVAVPIFYGFPKAAWLSLRGEIRLAGALTFIVAPVAWNVGLFTLSAGIAWVAPNLLNFLLVSWGFALGNSLGTLTFLLTLFSRNTRATLAAEFQHCISPYRLKENLCSA